MTARSTRNPEVFVGLASFGKRAMMLRTAVESLIDQVDRIGVYLNDYEEVPGFLAHPRIDVAVSADHGDLRDNGKFFFLEHSSHRFYAAADDDIKYPPNYIQRMMSVLIDAGTPSAVAVHGAVYPEKILGLFTSRRLFHYAESLQHVMPVHLVGTGTLLFEQAEWGLGFEEFGEPGMADIWFARSARKRLARLYVANRNKEWLKPLSPDGEVRTSRGRMPTLFAEAQLAESRQVELLAQAGISRGGYQRLIEALLESDTFGDQLTISQAIALDRIRRELGWLPVSTEFARSVQSRVVNMHRHWASIRDWSDEDTNAHSASIAGVLAQDIPSHTTVRTLDSLERLASLTENHQKEWSTLPYALRFDTRDHRLNAVRPELLALSARRGPDDARSLWPVLSRSLEAISPEVALDLEEAGVNTRFQRFPALMQLGALNPTRAGELLRDYLQMKEWSVIPEVLSWRRIFGKSFETKEVQLLLTVAALRGGHLGMAHRQLESLLHRWPDDTDVALLEAAMKATAASDTGEAIRPVLAELDRLGRRIGLRPYAEIIRSQHSASSHWIDLLDPGSREASALVSAFSPDVSVIMTVHNDESTIRAATSSILASEAIELELLIVDDASTDATAEVLAGISDPRVTVLTNPENLGPYVSRNRALEVARGAFIAIADADDWSHPDRLAYQRERLESENQALACTVAHLRILPNGIPDLENHLRFLGDGPMSLMFRRDVVDHIGGFDHVRTRGDVEYIRRLQARFGERALLALGTPLVLSTSTLTSNSKRFRSDVLDRYRIGFRNWHTLNATSDALHVDVTGDNRAPFIAPEELVVRATSSSPVGTEGGRSR